MKKQLSLLLCTTLALFSATTNKDFTLKDGKGVILNEPTNTYSTKIKSSDNLNTNLVLTLPSQAPSDNQILVVNSNGNLSWTDNNSSSLGSDNQKIDKFILDGNKIKISLENDGEADKEIDLSSITAFLKASDIKDNLTSSDTNKALSANQGKELKSLVDALNSSLSNHTSRTDNPHHVTKAQVGLGNVDNTSDADKPISTATGNALDNLDTKVTDINSTLSEKIADVNSSATLWSESDGNISRVSGNVGIGTSTPNYKFTVEHNSTEDAGYVLTSEKLIANPTEDQNHYFLANTMRVETPEDNDKYTRGLVGTSISVDKKGSGRVYVGETIQSLFYHRAGVGNYLGSIDAQASVSGGNVGYITGIGSNMYTSNDAKVSYLTGISTYGSISSSNTLTTAKGAWIRSFAGDGNITNVYGIHIENMAGRGTDKSYSLYSDGGISYFKDSVGIGTNTPQSSLQVSGYVQLDLTDGAPPAEDCDSADERGRMKVDNANGKLYICVDSGWIAK